jgi:hypothetical protein
MSENGPRIPVRGSAHQSGLVGLSPIERSRAREDAHLKWGLSLAKTVAEKNAAIAETTVCRVIGMFDDKPKDWDNLANRQASKWLEIVGEEFTAERRDQFIVASRQDALEAKLNTISILAELEALKKNQYRYQRTIWIALAFLSFGVSYLFFRT